MSVLVTSAAGVHVVYMLLADAVNGRNELKYDFHSPDEINETKWMTFLAI